MTTSISPPDMAKGPIPPLEPAPPPAVVTRRGRESLRDLLADLRALTRDSFAAAWRGAPGEIAWGRFVDTRV
ncbi:MAG: hypothetical protein GYA47_06455 [Desulfovibrio sp.]|nr:hypothetical protein [Desulfovibrio sp.]